MEFSESEAVLEEAKGARAAQSPLEGFTWFEGRRAMDDEIVRPSTH